MLVTVRVVPVAGQSPPDGAPVTIEVRDVSRADGPSVTVATADTVVGALGETTDGTSPTTPPDLAATDIPAAVTVAELEVDDELLVDGRDLAVWARVDLSGQPRVSAGDWITTQSYPVRAGVDAVDVEIRPI